MKHLALQAFSFVVILGLSCFASAGTQASDPIKIVGVATVDGLNILRLTVTGFNTNPAGCDAVDFVDIQLDAPGRSAEEQRLLVNAANLAFMTNRNVRLHIRDDICSISGTTLRLRVASGIAVLN